jgi:hypothetical protein
MPDSVIWNPISDGEEENDDFAKLRHRLKQCRRELRRAQRIADRRIKLSDADYKDEIARLKFQVKCGEVKAEFYKRMATRLRQKINEENQGAEELMEMDEAQAKVDAEAVAKMEMKSIPFRSKSADQQAR